MSSSRLSAQKSAPKATSSTDGDDHRKRRRNRTTQSCLNCHTTKRMCDRKRPCSRCSQLGLVSWPVFPYILSHRGKIKSGNCVYEVDDPDRGQQDESARLTNRIAELEGVIRELKNKPHPRWLAEQARPSTASDKAHISPPSSGGPSTPNAPVWAFPPASRYTPGIPFPSPAPALSPSSGNDSLESLFSTLTAHMSLGRGGTCGCLNEATCYNVVLELSLRLRKAADVLSRSPRHSMNSACALNTYISELDTLVKNSLLNLPSHSIRSSTLGRAVGRDKAAASSNIFDQYYPNDTTFSWDFEDFSVNNDDLMSWAPVHGTM
ncbi:hypothetical protein B0H17DRAFT_316487 [Mycena rosella]|uniref:Zn(2)-C6 fungal-type domain-containing protein n=1 Tax=Mycena rosella TaxID=1033263 RepID=A0AAD7DU14_MYCRO|nr:hypothetical protein B0H17DRAFT_316487 [Mycena rosella]